MTRNSPRTIAVAREDQDGAIWMGLCVLMAIAWSFLLTSCARGVPPVSGQQIAAQQLVSEEVTESSQSGEKSDAKSTEQLAILGSGCFWCTEAVYERMEGVNDVVSGYIGGHVENPTYQQVCGKKTGHAEAVQVYFDPSKTSFEELLKVFFKIHDPTTLNRQGADQGPQYRSSVFHTNEEQKSAAAKYIKKLNESGEFRNPIVTTLEPATKFYVAEEYHQDYFRRNPNAGYCQAVVANKVRKFNRSFGDKIRKDLK